MKLKLIGYLLMAIGLLFGVQLALWILLTKGALVFFFCVIPYVCGWLLCTTARNDAGEKTTFWQDLRAGWKWLRGGWRDLSGNVKGVFEEGSDGDR